MKGNGILHSSNSDEWTTPQDFFELLNQRGAFDFDGAATPENTKCKDFTSDFLNYPFKQPSLLTPRKRIFLNPPYSKIKDFVKHSFELGLDGHLVCLLIPARTDTKYWHDYVAKGSEIWFLKGRLKFGGAKSSAPFPSAVVIFGPPFYDQVKIKHWDWKIELKAKEMAKAVKTHVDSHLKNMKKEDTKLTKEHLDAHVKSLAKLLENL